MLHDFTIKKKCYMRIIQCCLDNKNILYFLNIRSLLVIGYWAPIRYLLMCSFFPLLPDMLMISTFHYIFQYMSIEMIWNVSSNNLILFFLIFLDEIQQWWLAKVKGGKEKLPLGGQYMLNKERGNICKIWEFQKKIFVRVCEI